MTENSILSELVYHPDEGSLRFKSVRYLLIRPETLASFQKALEAEVGWEKTGDILYAGGFTGGKLSGQKYKSTFGLSDREAVEFMCQMGREIGWGHFKLLELDPEVYYMLVEVTGSPFASAYGEAADSGVCHLIRGVLGGLGEGIFGEPVVAQEVRCTAMGDERCRFEIHSQTAV